MRSSNLTTIFIAISGLYLLLLLGGLDTIAWYIKPLLVLVLVLAVYKWDAFVTKNWLLLALLFSWIGDIILMFADKGELYFILGLTSFLVAHFFFIALFVKQKPHHNYLKNKLFWVGVLIVVLYLSSMLSVFFPRLGDLKIPVSVYAITISALLIMAIKGYFSWQNPAKRIVLIGTLFFVISDSLLAINKFYYPLPYASFLIMSTYVVAQYLISLGILKLNQKKLMW